MYTTLFIYSVLSLPLVHMKVTDSDVEEWLWGQRKMSQVLGTFRLLDFTMVEPVLTWHAS
jgi:hypothetical protein